MSNVTFVGAYLRSSSGHFFLCTAQLRNQENCKNQAKYFPNWGRAEGGQPIGKNSSNIPYFSLLKRASCRADKDTILVLQAPCITWCHKMDALCIILHLVFFCKEPTGPTGPLGLTRPMGLNRPAGAQVGMAMRMREYAVHADYAHFCE